MREGRASTTHFAAMLGLEADEGHDAHVHDGRKVVEQRDNDKHEQLISTVGTKQRQSLVQIHRYPVDLYHKHRYHAPSIYSRQITDGMRIRRVILVVLSQLKARLSL